MFAFTKEERKVLIFLMAIALIGIGANFLCKRFSAIESIICPSQEVAKINLNRADKRLLMTIPGIGEKLAERILSYREKQISFFSLEELKNIKGITDAKFKAIKESLALD